MDVKTEVFKHLLLELVTYNKHVIFESRSFKHKQDVWKKIHANLLGARLINPKRNWKGVRQQWYTFTHQARKSREQFLQGRIYDIPDFDKKVLAISGINIDINKEEVNNAVDRLNMESQIEVDTSTTKDHLEFTEHKILSPVPLDVEEDVKSNELLQKMEIDYLKRKVNEQKYKIQQYKLLKRRCEIYNLQNKNEREAFKKLL